MTMSRRGSDIVIGGYFDILTKDQAFPFSEHSHGPVVVRRANWFAGHYKLNSRAFLTKTVDCF